MVEELHPQYVLHQIEQKGGDGCGGIAALWQEVMRMLGEAQVILKAMSALDERSPCAV